MAVKVTVYWAVDKESLRDHYERTGERLADFGFAVYQLGRTPEEQDLLRRCPNRTDRNASDELAADAPLGMGDTLTIDERSDQHRPYVIMSPRLVGSVPSEQEVLWAVRSLVNRFEYEQKKRAAVA